jgi:chromosome partitioning protein
MSKVIAISNHKGGVGKTTSTINIGAGLYKLGKSVLLIDLDPQANLSQSLGITDPQRTIYGAIKGEYPATPIPVLTAEEREGDISPELNSRVKSGLRLLKSQIKYDVIPATLDLSGAEVELNGEAGREYILSEVLEPLRGSYDYILIDSPPSLGLLTVNAFTASDEVYIPLQAEYLAIQGLKKLIEVIDKIRKRINKKLVVGGVFITLYDSRKVLNRDVVDTVQGYLGAMLFKTRIRANVALAEAPAKGLDIFRYQAKSYGAEDYLALCKEITKR